MSRSKRRRARTAKPPERPQPAREDSRLIVDAILEAVVERCDPDDSLATIAKRAGVGATSLHRYFPTRDSIYAEVSRRLQASFTDALRDRLRHGGTDVPTVVLEICRMAIAGENVDLRLRRRLNADIPLAWTWDNAEAHFGEAIELTVAWLREREPSAPDDLEDRVFAAFAATRGMIILSTLWPERAPEPEALARHLSRAVLGILRGGAAGQPTDPPA